MFPFFLTCCLGNDETGKTALSNDNRANACSLLDATSLVFGPAEFSQVTSDISAPHAVEAGQHQLSVRLASKPGSFITVEIRFLPEDTEPPEISIEPADGAVDFDRLEDFLRVYRIENFWEADEENPWQEILLSDVFVGHEWSCAGNGRCCDPVNLPNSKNVLVLSVNPANPEILVDRHYRIEFRGCCECYGYDEPPEGCSENPIESWDGYPLDPTLNVFVGLVEEGAQPPDSPFLCPFIVGETPDMQWQPGEFFLAEELVSPHQVLRFPFSRQMGFVNLAPDPVDGLNLRHRTEGSGQFRATVLESDSAQGLLPDTLYQLDFLSSDLAPPGDPPGIPPPRRTAMATP